MKHLNILILSLTIVFLVGCMSSVNKPYSQFYVPQENIKSLTKVLLIGPELVLLTGPELDVLRLTDEAWPIDTKNVWQGEITKKWAELRARDNNLFELVLPTNTKDHYIMLANLIAEQKLNELPLFDEKTGKKNKEIKDRTRTTYGKLAQKTGVDAVMHVNLAVFTLEVPYSNDSPITDARWDGQVEYVEDWDKVCFLCPTIHTKVKFLVISLLAQLFDKDGKLLCESRGGYKLSRMITSGVDPKTVSFEEEFDKKYGERRSTAITLVLSAIANLKMQ